MKKFLKILLSEFSSDISRFEKEFIFLDFEKSNDGSDGSDGFVNKQNYVASDCFIAPPNKGDFYVVKDAIWQVVSVTHSFGFRNPGYIFLQKQRESK